jgi:hypothetical protein
VDLRKSILPSVFSQGFDEGYDLAGMFSIGNTLEALPMLLSKGYAFQRIEVLHDINRPMQDIDWVTKLTQNRQFRTNFFEHIIEFDNMLEASDGSA